MKQRYLDYASYNIWANNRIISDLLLLDDTLLSRELVGSFPTIRATILHIWYAELGWLSRLKTNRWEAVQAEGFSGANDVLFRQWKETSRAFRDFVAAADIEQPVRFQHKGKGFVIPAREVMQTVFNHGSFHRGQVVMMMRQVGATEISQTDYIEWVRQVDMGVA